jgi:hypothetical protein
MATANPLVDLAWRELQAHFDDELHQLPPKYRTPLVVCYLEGKTSAEAARQLGWSIDSLASWLKGGRELLRHRLAQRQLELPTGLFRQVLCQKARAHSLPPGLARATVLAAKNRALGTTAGIAPAVRLLADGARGWLKWVMVNHQAGSSRTFLC